MTLSSHLQVALKEWHIVCRALAGGRQSILLRKGGIHEASSGFELEHPAFLLFPTYLHQNAEMLKPDAREGLEVGRAEPDQIALDCAAVVTDIVRLSSREQVHAVDDQHIWTEPLIDMRFNYRPDNPLYLLIVRAFRLPKPVTIDNTPAYAGCKSWVPLDTAIDVSRAAPALSDYEHESRRTRILEFAGRRS